MPARRLVALDLDGTLLTYESTLPAGHVRAVAELRALGAEVAIVTGRMVLTAQWVWDELRMTTPLVAFNGGWVGFPGKSAMAAAPLAEAEVREILSALAEYDGARTAYPDAMTWLMDREIPRTIAWREIYRVDIQIGAAPFRDWRGPSHKVMFITEPEQVPRVLSELRALFRDRYQVVVSQNDRIEILPGAISKAWGLAKLASHLQIEQADVWAVGDADNDREMLQWSGHPCVMGQAEPHLLCLARHILPGVQARGLCALPGIIACDAGLSQDRSAR